MEAPVLRGMEVFILGGGLRMEVGVAFRMKEVREGFIMVEGLGICYMYWARCCFGFCYN